MVAGVVGEVDFGAVATAVNLGTERWGATRHHGVRRPVMGAGEQVAVGRGKARPVHREDGRKVQGVRASRGLALGRRDDLRVEPGEGFLCSNLTDVSEVQVNEGGLDVVVTEVALQLAK